jgi:hypothetical protein
MLRPLAEALLYAIAFLIQDPESRVSIEKTEPPLSLGAKPAETTGLFGDRS